MVNINHIEKRVLQGKEAWLGPLQTFKMESFAGIEHILLVKCCQKARRLGFLQGVPGYASESTELKNVFTKSTNIPQPQVKLLFNFFIHYPNRTKEVSAVNSIGIFLYIMEVCIYSQSVITSIHKKSVFFMWILTLGKFLLIFHLFSKHFIIFDLSLYSKSRESFMTVKLYSVELYTIA